MVSSITLNNSKLQIDFGKLFLELDDERRYKFVPATERDTIASEWFAVENIADLNILYSGDPEANAVWTLQRKSDGQTLRLNVAPNFIHRTRTVSYQLVNSRKDELYRIIFVKPNEQWYFSQEIILMPDPDGDDILFKAPPNNQIVDLETMSINPNQGINILDLLI